MFSLFFGGSNPNFGNTLIGNIASIHDNYDTLEPRVTQNPKIKGSKGGGGFIGGRYLENFRET